MLFVLFVTMYSCQLFIAW